MRADLHFHSLCSDGALTPEELMYKAASAGLELVALTDHDNMGGVEEAEKAAGKLGLAYVRGWEVSAYRGACKVHILGYGCKKEEAYTRFLQERFDGAIIRAKDMIERANAYFGLDVTLEEVETYHLRKYTPVHTMHIAQAFGRRLSRGRRDLYNEVFARGGPAFSESCRPTPQDAIRVIHEDGGIAVLAHPGRILDLDEDKYQRYRSADQGERALLKAESDARRDVLMQELVTLGIDGIECVYTTHTALETECFKAFARERGLFITGGSDYHQDGAQSVLGLPFFEADKRLIERLL